MSEPRRRRFVSGTDVSRCDEECLRTGFCTDFCKVGQDFLTLRQPASEPVSERLVLNEHEAEIIQACVTAAMFDTPPNSGDYRLMRSVVLKLAALAAARGDTP